MKQSILVATVLAVMAASCKDKDKGTSTPTSSLTVRQQAMIGKDWMIQSVMLDTMDVTPFIEDCIKDNVIHHFTDASTGYADEGATKCDPLDSQRLVQTWKLINNESRLIVTQSGERDTFEILNLNTAELKYKVDDTIITLKRK